MASAPKSWILSAVRPKSATGCGKRPRFPAHDITKPRATLRQISNPPLLTSAWLKRERPPIGGRPLTTDVWPLGRRLLLRHLRLYGIGASAELVPIAILRGLAASGTS